MTADCLLDTNVLVYAVDATPKNRAKQARAIELIETVNFGLSAQVLQEFYVTATRKLEKPLKPQVALQFLDRFRVFPIVAVDQRLIVEGIQNSLKFQISYWDGAILAAANRMNATVVYSEDLNHGQQYGTTKVINPFLDKTDRV
jgi:predicted nucleic acid-binding protein